MEYEIIHGLLSLLPNERLQRIMHAHLETVGGVDYDAEALAFAEQIGPSMDASERNPADAARVEPFAFGHGFGSTDVVDVSWAVPTAGHYRATRVPGTSAHSWQALAEFEARRGPDFVYEPLLGNREPPLDYRD